MHGGTRGWIRTYAKRVLCGIGGGAGVITGCVAVLAVSSLLSASLVAQTLCPSPCTVKTGQAYSYLFDHDGLDTLGYRIYHTVGTAETKVLEFAVADLKAGTVTKSFTASASPGTLAVQAAAYNEVGETRAATKITLIAKGAPAPPGNQRFLVTIVASLSPSGRVTFDVLRVEPVE